MGAGCSTCCTTDVDNRSRVANMDTFTPSSTDEDAGLSMEGFPGSKNSMKSATDHPEILKQEWMTAVETSNNKGLRELFKLHRKQLNFLNVVWDDGDNSLHKAVQLNNVKLARFLIILKIDINCKNDINGYTALHYAVMKSNERMVKMLLKVKNIDISLSNNKGVTPLNMAESDESKNLSIQKLLLVSTTQQSISRETTPEPFLKSPIDATHASNNSIDSISVDNSINSGHTRGRSENSNLGAKPTLAQRSISADSLKVRDTIGGVSLSHYSNGSNNSMDLDDVIGDPSNLMKAFKEVNTASAPMPARMNGSTVKQSHIELKGKLEKKQSKFPRSFHDAWVIICKPYILWSGNQVDLTNKDINKERTRLKFDGFISISAIERINTKKKKEFTLVVRNAHHVRVKRRSGKETKALKIEKSKEFTFRCKNEDVRDKWVREINRCMDSSMQDALLELYQTGSDI